MKITEQETVGLAEYIAATAVLIHHLGQSSQGPVLKARVERAREALKGLHKKLRDAAQQQV